jgi:hypothetical protein
MLIQAGATLHGLPLAAGPSSPSSGP